MKRRSRRKENETVDKMEEEEQEECGSEATDSLDALVSPRSWDRGMHTIARGAGKRRSCFAAWSRVLTLSLVGVDGIFLRQRWLR